MVGRTQRKCVRWTPSATGWVCDSCRWATDPTMRLGVGPIAMWLVEDSVTSPVELADDNEITSELPTVVVTEEAALDDIDELIRQDYALWTEPLTYEISSASLTATVTEGAARDHVEEMLASEHASSAEHLSPEIDHVPLAVAFSEDAGLDDIDELIRRRRAFFEEPLN